MNDILSNLQFEIRNVFNTGSGHQVNISSMTAYRFTEEIIYMPQIDNPYLYIVLDGMLRLYTPSGIMDYMAGQYSISKIDTPLYGTVVSFSEHHDFLAVALEITNNDVIASVLELDNE